MPDDDMVLVRRDDLREVLRIADRLDECPPEPRRRLLAAVNGEAATVEYGAERPSPLCLPDGESTAWVLDATFSYREKAEAFVRNGSPYSRVVSRHVGPWTTQETP